MPFRRPTAQCAARKLKRGMTLALEDGTTVEILNAYPVMDVPGAPIWLDFATGTGGAVDANEVLTVLR